jgi:hypothetical protein
MAILACRDLLCAVEMAVIRANHRTWSWLKVRVANCASRIELDAYIGLRRSAHHCLYFAGKRFPKLASGGSLLHGLSHL